MAATYRKQANGRQAVSGFKIDHSSLRSIWEKNPNVMHSSDHQSQARSTTWADLKGHSDTSAFGAPGDTTAMPRGSRLRSLSSGFSDFGMMDNASPFRGGYLTTTITDDSSEAAAISHNNSEDALPPSHPSFMFSKTCDRGVGGIRQLRDTTAPLSDLFASGYDSGGGLYGDQLYQPSEGGGGPNRQRRSQLSSPISLYENTSTFESQQQQHMIQRGREQRFLSESSASHTESVSPQERSRRSSSLASIWSSQSPGGTTTPSFYSSSASPSSGIYSCDLSSSMNSHSRQFSPISPPSVFGSPLDRITEEDSTSSTSSSSCSKTLPPSSSSFTSGRKVLRSVAEYEENMKKQLKLLADEVDLIEERRQQREREEERSQQIALVSKAISQLLINNEQQTSNRGRSPIKSTAGIDLATIKELLGLGKTTLPSHPDTHHRPNVPIGGMRRLSETLRSGNNPCAREQGTFFQQRHPIHDASSVLNGNTPSSQGFPFNRYNPSTRITTTPSSSTGVGIYTGVTSLTSTVISDRSSSHGGFTTSRLTPYEIALEKIEREAKSRRSSAYQSDAKFTWSGHLMPVYHQSPVYASKVFVGGLPYEVTPDALNELFSSFGVTSVQFPPRGRGHAYLVFDSDSQVQALLNACETKGPGQFYYWVSSRRGKDRRAQIIPWATEDSDWLAVVDGSHGDIFHQRTKGDSESSPNNCSPLSFLSTSSFSPSSKASSPILMSSSESSLSSNSSRRDSLDSLIEVDTSSTSSSPVPSVQTLLGETTELITSGSPPPTVPEEMTRISDDEHNTTPTELVGDSSVAVNRRAIQYELTTSKQNTIFVGALHGEITAAGLQKILSELFGPIVHVGIDTDKNRYPNGSARVTFANRESFRKAVLAEFVHVVTPRFSKTIQLDAYIEDGICSECSFPTPVFCRHPDCFKYYCALCFEEHRSEQGEYHPPVMRNRNSSVGNTGVFTTGSLNKDRAHTL